MRHEIRWTSQKIRQRLSLIEPLVYIRRQQLPPFRLKELAGPQVQPPVEPDLDASTWQLVESDAHWIGPLTDFVLRGRFVVPPDWSTDNPVALLLPLGEAGDFSHPEALLYIDGVPYAANDRHHQEIVLAPEFCDGERHSIALHGWSGGTRVDPANRLQMRLCAVVQIEPALRDFITLARVALGVADQLEKNHPTRAHLYGSLDRAFALLDTRAPLGEAFYLSVPAAYDVLQDGISHSGPAHDASVTAVGHAHIDVAWLWTLDQTRRKAGRTFYNVIRLMEQFPEFHFSQSQPQLYDFVRQDYPGLFERIRDRIEEGRWEPLGGMWIESDCNLAGGEALVRQFLLGRTFFREQFGPGADSPVLWLPDAFGFGWSLPQLIKEAGLDYFFTIKLGWSQYNRLPYDSFWWQGLDGSKVLAHFSTTRESASNFASTYNALATPEQVLSTWTNFQQQDYGSPGSPPPLLMAYGHGDGGGGPTHEMLENIRQMAAFPATPRVHTGTVRHFFQELESQHGPQLPTWDGELYLEYHRGTYTSQARNKRANRQSEFLLHDAEFLASMTATLDNGYEYPRQPLERAWQLVCLNQFHDILPGTSIGQVYAESLEQYAEVRTIARQVVDGALQALSAQSGGDLLVVNPCPFEQRQPAFWPDAPQGVTALQTLDGRPVTVQPVAGGLLLDAGALPSYSVSPLILTTNQDAGEERPDSLRASERRLENDRLLVAFDHNGDICRLFDKQNQREVLAPGSVANQFQLFEDRPKTPDAWEIDINYDDRMWLAGEAESIVVHEHGPLRASLLIKRRFLSSELTQRVSLARNSARLDFVTTVDWHEKFTLLKVAFPIDILASSATYEIQWGNIQRPTHQNTSWDWARFETWAHKWVDLSEGDFGVSLLNDCKYGHDITANVMRLSLLRGSTDPDPDADLGVHHFTYSLLPHTGTWESTTIPEAYALNDPAIVWPAVTGRPRHMSAAASWEQPFVKADRSNVVIETIKQAEDGQGLIVRLFECKRRRGPVRIRTAFKIGRAWRTTILEENLEEILPSDRELQLQIRPYQIITLRLIPAIEN